MFETKLCLLGNFQGQKKKFHAHSKSFCFLTLIEASDLQMIEFFSDPDNLLYCPSAAIALGTWAEHKLASNFV